MQRRSDCVHVPRKYYLFRAADAYLRLRLTKIIRNRKGNHIFNQEESGNEQFVSDELTAIYFLSRFDCIAQGKKRRNGTYAIIERSVIQSDLSFSSLACACSSIRFSPFREER